MNLTVEQMALSEADKIFLSSLSPTRALNIAMCDKWNDLNGQVHCQDLKDFVIPNIRLLYVNNLLKNQIEGTLNDVFGGVVQDQWKKLGLLHRDCLKGGKYFNTGFYVQSENALALMDADSKICKANRARLRKILISVNYANYIEEEKQVKNVNTGELTKQQAKETISVYYAEIKHAENQIKDWQDQIKELEAWINVSNKYSK